MHEASLSSSWGKVRQAKEHRDTLERYILDTFIVESNRPTVGVKFDNQTREHLLYISEMPDFSSFLEKVAVITGDIIHNLRGALDHLAFQLAWLRTNGNIRNPRAIQFPIADTLNDFQRQRDRYLREVKLSHQTIIDGLQPYHGTAGRPDSWSGPYIHQLSLLRDLSDTDKHRTLNAVLALPTAFTLSGHAGAILLAELEGHTDRVMRGEPSNLREIQPVELGAEIARARISDAGAELEVKVAGHVTPQIALAERRPIIPTLDRITAFVVDVPRQFEPFFRVGDSTGRPKQPIPAPCYTPPERISTKEAP